MKHAPLVLALLVLAGIGLAFALSKPEPADASLFGSEMALSPELAPLTIPVGTLELHGSVHAADGSAAADAFLALLRGEDDPSSAEPLYHAYTDEHGHFALSGLAPGPYRVLLTHPSAPLTTLPIELPFEGEASFALAAPLPPLPALPELARTSLAGKIRMPEALAGDAGVVLALQGFEVVLRPAQDTPLLSGASERRVTSGEDGAFALDELVVGRYDVEVLPPWALGGSWPVLVRGSYDARAARGSATEPLVVTLEVGALAGALQEAEKRPLAGALVKVSALDARDPVGDPQLWPPSVTDPDGNFRVELLPPGRYHLHLRAGSAAHDVDVVVEAGKVTRLPSVSLDPRAPAEPTGG